LNLFQTLALVVVGVLFLMTLMAIGRGWASRREGAIWVLVWVGAAFAIIWPDATTYIAQKLGIRRGADLLLYCAVVAMMTGFLMVYVRLRRIRREMTLLVRQLAIRDAVITPPLALPEETPASKKQEEPQTASEPGKSSPTAAD